MKACMRPLRDSANSWQASLPRSGGAASLGSRESDVLRFVMSKCDYFFAAEIAECGGLAMADDDDVDDEEDAYHQHTWW